MSDLCRLCTDRGMCCRYVELPLGRFLSTDERRWVELHPELHILDLDGLPVLHIDTTCSALMADGFCDLYGTATRPEMCSIWPDRPEKQAPPGCAYLVPELALVAVAGHVP